MLAERLVTLPTHEFVAPGDVQRICRAIEHVQQGDGLKPVCSSRSREEQHSISELPRVN
jgi:hypothetical protein